MFEEKLEIKNEFYLSFVIDRTEKNVVVMFSKEGGIDIEGLSRKFPEKVIKEKIKLDFDLESAKELSKKFEISHELIFNLYKLMKEYDCELVEINPLVLDNDDKLIAVDSKVIIDDNSLFRHEEFSEEKREGMTEVEKIALENGLHYVDLDGDIAVIGNGAGLVMATLDIVEHFGGKAANFLDVGGGASVEKMEKSIELVLMKSPKGIFVNIFGGITKCDDIAQGIVNYKKNNGIEIPMVIRMIGTNEKEAKKILMENNIFSLDSMEESTKKIVELVKNADNK
ncbi:ATP-grasp domain-containing protein [Nanoarchaeota archaeon]